MSNIKQAILDIIDQLPSAERRLADAVLSNVNQLAIYSAHELAEKANVSAATASRFFKRLGFANFNDFKAEVKQQHNNAAPLDRLSFQPIGIPQKDLEDFIRTDVQNITETFHAITQSHIDSFTSNVVHARHIWIVGFRNGQILASYLQALLQQLRSDVLLFVSVVAHIPEQLSDISKDDLVIVMDFRRRSMLLKGLVNYVREENAKLAIFTDLLEEPITKNTDTVFTVSTKSEYLFDSYAGTMSLINFLANRVAIQIGKQEVSKKLQKIESIHRSMRDIIFN